MIEKVMEMITYDGHVHTPFCPHGTNDPFEAYIERAIELGIQGLTFTEHAPLPSRFTDPTPEQDSAMHLEEMDKYIDTLSRLKKEYASQISIQIGLEVDYIEGYEEETRTFLMRWGKYLDDAILSVHFLRFDDDYFCLDFSADVFAQIIEKAGSLDNVYKKYFQTVKRSLLANLGKFKPTRIGHMTLVRKFQKQFPSENTYKSAIIELLDLMKLKGYELDYNGAGLTKPLCGESYPSSWIINEAVKRGIPLVYGSDAHSVKGLGQGFNHLYLNHKTTIPTLFKQK